MDKVSIIVPVYNTEPKYLRQCIESIIEQDYSNIEIILVDDGSTNLAGEICDQYQKQDGRVLVVHQKNEGVSYARNKGIEMATGEWIAFVDADDWMEKKSISTVMKNIGEKKCDLVIWNMYINYSWTEKVCNNYQNSFYSAEESEINAINLRLLRTISINRSEKNITTINYPFCHLYRRELIQQQKVKFDSAFKQGEDKLFNYQYCVGVSSMMYLNIPLYHYRQHSMSVSHKFYKDHVDNTTRILKKYYEIEPRIKTDKEYRDTYSIRVSYYAWWLIRKYYLHEDSTVKKPIKEFKKMVQSSPYIESINMLNLSGMQNSLTKLRLIMLKLHMYQLLFLDAKVELKIRKNRKI